MIKNAVTVIGSINYDIIFKQKRLPAIGETLSADNVTFSCGGKGANQAVQCAKLGLKTYMVGKIGNDNFGSELLSNMEKYGLNTTYISQADTNTGLGIVNSLEDGRLVSTISKGANYSLKCEDIDHVESIIKKSKIVILQLEIPKEVVEYSIQTAKKYDCYIILNAAPACQIDEKYLRMVDCFVVNETEASFYSGENITTVESAKQVCKELYEYANHLLVITLGEKGSILYDGNEILIFPSKKVNVVETTGAGDSFIGALAYGIMNEKSYDEMGEFASLVSSRTVTKIGGQEAMPTLKELYN
ncbi:ribokinase [Lederbergia citrea]|uniref:Ribokinase n=1 Tax=Lederbergia citrea TaxID=2833581 RepID=A0A942UKV6_9BACI|nr:ribokinase [Lederbergia citrea]MBS4223326.1 ribokinase [Lederbergia citrea]